MGRRIYLPAPPPASPRLRGSLGSLGSPGSVRSPVSLESPGSVRSPGSVAPRSPRLCPVGKQPWGALGVCSPLPEHHQRLSSPATPAQRWVQLCPPHPSPQPLSAGGAPGQRRPCRTRCHPSVPAQHHPLSCLCWDLRPPIPTPQPRTGPRTRGTGWELQHIIY